MPYMRFFDNNKQMIFGRKKIDFRKKKLTNYVVTRVELIVRDDCITSYYRDIFPMRSPLQRAISQFFFFFREEPLWNYLMQLLCSFCHSSSILKLLGLCLFSNLAYTKNKLVQRKIINIAHWLSYYKNHISEKK